MNIYQLLEYNHPTSLNNLDLYYKTLTGCNLEKQTDKEVGINIDTEIESLSEIDKLMRIPSTPKAPMK